MKTIRVVMVLFLVGWVPSAYAGGMYTGNDWIEWKASVNTNMRYAYAVGFMEGVTVTSIFHAGVTKKTDSHKLLDAHSFEGMDIDQVVAGLDRLFSDFRNRDIGLRDAMFVVKRQIEGLSETNTDLMLQELRSGKSIAFLFIGKNQGGGDDLLSFPIQPEISPTAK